MMQIMFEEAKHEALAYLLQKQWLLHLIKAWRDRPFLPMSICAGEFERKHKDAKTGQVKAFPVYEKNHFNYTVSRYIAAFLPKTNDALWDGASDDSVLAIMNKERFLDTCADIKKFKEESKERTETKKIMSTASAEMRACKDNNERHARRSWRTVK